MPFSLEQKRPNKTRFEIDAGGQKTLRVFDGTRGWKSRPGRDGGRDVQPYTAQEIKFALDAQGMDGPLIDYEAKGNSVALEGVEDIEGTRSYRLSVRLASGQMQKVWIDAQTFLDLRYDRMNYNVAGAPGTVSVFYGDYRNVDGVQIPATRVIGLGSGKTPDRMQLERITVNAPMNDRLFAQPAANKRHGAGAFGSNAAPSGNPAMSVSGSNPDPASAPR
jgi:hypothetical protein